MPPCAVLAMADASCTGVPTYWVRFFSLFSSYVTHTHTHTHTHMEPNPIHTHSHTRV